MRKRSASAPLILGMLAALLAGFAQAGELPPGIASDVPVGSDVGQLAPDFTLPILDGGTFHLYEEVPQYNATVLVFFLAAT